MTKQTNCDIIRNNSSRVGRPAGLEDKELTDTLNAMADKHADLEFVEYIARAIVNNPKDVSVERTIDERGVLLTLHINPEDMGYVIGRQGQTARALRTLLRIVGAKDNARVNLKIYEPEGSRRPPRRDDTRSSEVDTSAVDNLTI
ncbi:MAG: KH domain-containing protein [bacterium]|nr:KH domain-containing protein [bacterium]